MHCLYIIQSLKLEYLTNNNILFFPIDKCRTVCECISSCKHREMTIVKMYINCKFM